MKEGRTRESAGKRLVAQAAGLFLLLFRCRARRGSDGAMQIAWSGCGCERAPLVELLL